MVALQLAHLTGGASFGIETFVKTRFAAQFPIVVTPKPVQFALCLLTRARSIGPSAHAPQSIDQSCTAPAAEYAVMVTAVAIVPFRSPHVQYAPDDWSHTRTRMFSYLGTV